VSCPCRDLSCHFRKRLGLIYGGNTTHETCFAKTVADRVIFMDGGKIIEQNSLQAFFDNPQQ